METPRVRSRKYACLKGAARLKFQAGANEKLDLLLLGGATASIREARWGIEKYVEKLVI
ncbi:hypothetical protein [Aeromonas salmonicida]|uniref:hypothetical protein n=1 Tax=Aeromonas salmonicida TaxID=645 RepID=UPI00259D62E8|nr:hypothetical protein [Aeromonas salmonicida]MDM5067254.1 hypothetical protein [Aeromonas salmonicida]